MNSGIIIRYNQSNIFIKTNEIYSIDDLISIKLFDIKKLDDSKQFDRYLKSEGINYFTENFEINLTSYRNSIRRIILNYLTEGSAYYSRYVPLVLLGIRNSKNEVIINKIKNISVLHLFTISGFHINIIIFLLEKFLNKMKFNNKYIHLSLFLFIFVYLAILNVPIAATRAFLFSLFCSINKSFLKDKFHKLNILALTMLIFFFINPYVVFSMSFIFTYIMMYSIILVNSSLNKKYMKIKTFITTMIFSWIINILSSNRINILSFMSNSFFSPIISFSYVLTFIFFWLKPVIDDYYLLIDILLNIWQYIVIDFVVNIDLNWIVIITSMSFLFLLTIIKKPTIMPENSLIRKIINDYN